MGETVLNRMLEEVVEEIGLPEGSARIDAALGARGGEAFQVRVKDESGEEKAVAVTLRDRDGHVLEDEELKARLRQQLETFRKIEKM